MQCLYCGKPLGFLKELTDGEFCSAQHRQRYVRLTKVALARLLGSQSSSPGERAKEQVRTDPRPAAAPAASASRTGCPTRLGEPLLQTLKAMAAATQPKWYGEPLKKTMPALSLSRLTVAPVKPAWGPAGKLWARLESTVHAGAVSAIRPAVEPNAVTAASATVKFISGMLRQEGTPSLREANFVSSPANILQPQPSASGRYDGFVRPVLDFRTAVAMPASAAVEVTQSLVLAQPIPRLVDPEVLPAAAVRVAPTPLAFQPRIEWRTSPLWRLSTVCDRAFAGRAAEQPAPFLGYMAPEIRPVTAAAPRVPPTPLAFQPRIEWRTSPLWRLSTVCGRAFAGRAAEQPAPFLGYMAPEMRPVAAAALRVAPTPLAFQPRIEWRTSPLWRLSTVCDGAFAGPAAELRAQFLGSLAPPLRADLAPVSAVAAMKRQEAVPVQPAVLCRLPVLKTVPVKETFGREGTVAADVRIRSKPAEPVRSVADSMMSPYSALPTLASVLRHARMAKAQRISPVVLQFAGIHPRNLASVPRAFLEVPAPVPAPRLPDANAIRIIETFQYMRHLDQPPLTPVEALIRLWRRTPAFVRVAAAAASLIVMLWAASPDPSVRRLANNQLEEVRKTIQSRAAIELTDDFSRGMPDWEGEENWIRTWSFERAGFARPGRLALYRPSMTMQDYRIEFLAQIEKKSVGWVYRAEDKGNYYASKITVLRPGPLPTMSLVRYPVIDGKKGPAVEIPIRVLMHNDTPYRVQITVKGRDFSTSIEGQLVDFWRDDRLRAGGVGFFSDTGERARIYWVKLSHQDDFVGRVCAYFYPNPIQTRGGT